MSDCCVNSVSSSANCFKKYVSIELEQEIVCVSYDSGIIWHKPVPTQTISVFDVGGSGESGESGKLATTRRLFCISLLFVC